MNGATARICELERQLAIAVAAIHRAELELLGAAEDLLRDRQLSGTPQDMAARFLRPAYALRATLAKLPGENDLAA
jgi:hypothetical protein